MRKTMILTGLALVVMGVLLPWLAKIPLGRLPGDIVVRKPGFTLYVPVTTMIALGLVLSLVLWLLKR